MTEQSQVTQRVSAIRDRARLQAHLFSMDARERWRAFEDELLAVEYQLAKGGENALAAAAEKTSDILLRAEAFFARYPSGELSLSSPARHAMTDAVETCSPADSLNEAAKIMWEDDCGVVPVVDHAGLLIGMLTDRDVSMACYTQGKSPAHASVASAMSQATYRLGPDASLSEVIALMKAHAIRRVPIVTEQGNLLGLVTLADLFRHLPKRPPSSAFEAALVDALVAISERRGPDRTVRAAIAAE